MLVRVVAPYFVAGFVIEAGYVVEAAPIIRYMQWRKWTAERARAYIAKRGWRATIVKGHAPCP